MDKENEGSSDPENQSPRKDPKSQEKVPKDSEDSESSTPLSARSENIMDVDTSILHKSILSPTSESDPPKTNLSTLFEEENVVPSPRLSILGAFDPYQQIEATSSEEQTLNALNKAKSESALKTDLEHSSLLSESSDFNETVIEKDVKTTQESSQTKTRSYDESQHTFDFLESYVARSELPIEQVSDVNLFVNPNEYKDGERSILDLGKEPTLQSASQPPKEATETGKESAEDSSKPEEESSTQEASTKQEESTTPEKPTKTPTHPETNEQSNRQGADYFDALLNEVTEKLLRAEINDVLPIAPPSTPRKLSEIITERYDPEFERDLKFLQDTLLKRALGQQISSALPVGYQESLESLRGLPREILHSLVQEIREPESVPVADVARRLSLDFEVESICIWPDQELLQESAYQLQIEALSAQQHSQTSSIQQVETVGSSQIESVGSSQTETVGASQDLEQDLQAPSTSFQEPVPTESEYSYEDHLAENPPALHRPLFGGIDSTPLREPGTPLRFDIYYEAYKLAKSVPHGYLDQCMVNTFGRKVTKEEVKAYFEKKKAHLAEQAALQGAASALAYAQAEEADSIAVGNFLERISQEALLPPPEELTPTTDTTNQSTFRPSIATPTGDIVYITPRLPVQIPELPRSPLRFSPTFERSSISFESTDLPSHPTEEPERLSQLADSSSPQPRTSFFHAESSPQRETQARTPLAQAGSSPQRGINLFPPETTPPRPIQPRTPVFHAATTPQRENQLRTPVFHAEQSPQRETQSRSPECQTGTSPQRATQPRTSEFPVGTSPQRETHPRTPVAEVSPQRESQSKSPIFISPYPLPWENEPRTVLKPKTSPQRKDPRSQPTSPQRDQPSQPTSAYRNPEEIPILPREENPRTHPLVIDFYNTIKGFPIDVIQQHCPGFYIPPPRSPPQERQTPKRGKKPARSSRGSSGPVETATSPGSSGPVETATSPVSAKPVETVTSPESGDTSQSTITPVESSAQITISDEAIPQASDIIARSPVESTDNDQSQEVFQLAREEPQEVFQLAREEPQEVFQLAPDESQEVFQLAQEDIDDIARTDRSSGNTTNSLVSLDTLVYSEESPLEIISLESFTEISQIPTQPPKESSMNQEVLNAMGDLIHQEKFDKEDQNPQGDLDNKSALDAMMDRLSMGETDCERLLEQVAELKKELKSSRQKTVAAESEVAALKERASALNALVEELQVKASASPDALDTKEAEITELKAREEALMGALKEAQILLKQNDSKLKDLQQKEVKLADDLSNRTQSEVQISRVMNEYEKSISSLVAENEKMKKERDTAQMHLANIELAFSDVHQKYERCKQVVQGYKDNETSFKQDITLNRDTIAKQEEKYEMLKAHAMAQLEKSNFELANMKKQYETELAKLTAQLKRFEIKNSSLQEALHQKTKECEQLSAVCDEFIGPV